MGRFLGIRLGGLAGLHLDDTVGWDAIGPRMWNVLAIPMRI